MTGHVFHPGHEELHGVTVVVERSDGRVYVGRYHEKSARGVILHDVAVHDPESGLTPTAWLERQRRFGVEGRQRSVVLPVEEVASISRLAVH